MIRIDLPVVIVGRGQWGPFRDDPNFGTPQARTIPYIKCADPTGDATFNLTIAEGADVNGLEMFKPTLLDVEVFGRDEKIAARCHGVAKK